MAPNLEVVEKTPCVKLDMVSESMVQKLVEDTVYPFDSVSFSHQFWVSLDPGFRSTRWMVVSLETVHSTERLGVKEETILYPIIISAE